MTQPHITADDGCKIAWKRSGTSGKPTLILSNSLGTDMRLWDAQLDAFSPHFDILRYDTRGHGASDAPEGSYSLDRLGRDVLQLLDHHNIAQAYFAGVSLGGMTGQWLGYRAPDRINRIILANTSAYMGPPSGWADRINAVLANGMDPMADPVLIRWFTPEFQASNTQEVENVRKQLLATEPAGYAGCSAAIRDMDLRPTAELIKSSTLIIAGLRDPATPPEHADWLLSHITGSTLVALDAAHLSNIEQSEKFNDAVLEFLKEDT